MLLLTLTMLQLMLLMVLSMLVLLLLMSNDAVDVAAALGVDDGVGATDAADADGVDNCGEVAVDVADDVAAD